MTAVPPPEEPSPSFPWSDLDAKREERDWANESLLNGQKTANEVSLLWVYGKLLIVFMFFFVLLFLGSLASWTLHYLLPISYHWLTAEQLSKIQSVLFSGSIGGVVSLVAQRHFLK
jgi:hypothetical protein